MALEKDPINGSNADSGNSSGVDVDVENGTKGRFESNGKSLGGRIAPVLPHLQRYDFGSDDSGSDILGKQIQFEASNAIQYRTCSWPKVNCLLPTIPGDGFAPVLETDDDDDDDDDDDQDFCFWNNC
jgi:hypothetical protein